MNAFFFVSFFSTERSAMESNWMEALGWTLVHSVWQLFLIGIVFVIGRAILTAGSRSDENRIKQNSVFNYWLGCFCLTAMLIAPATTFLMLSNIPVQNAQRSDLTSAERVMTSLGEVVPTQPAKASDPIAFGLSSLQSVAESEQVATQAAVTPVKQPGNSLSSIVLRDWFRLAVNLWLVGVLIFALRPVLGVLNARRLRTCGLLDLSEPVSNSARNVVDRMGFQRVVLFAGSALVEVPTVVGYFKPIVLIPAAAMTGLSPEQLNQILAHELAHIRRHDYLINLAQTVIESLLFYHPAVWWLSHQIRLERENCCDDLAVESFGTAHSLAKALLQLEQTRTVAPPALAAGGGSLVKRVRRLLNRPAAARGSAAGGICASALLISSLTLIAVFATGFPASVANESEAAELTATGPNDGIPVPAVLETENLQSEKASLVGSGVVAVQTVPVTQTSNDVLATVNGQQITRQQVAQRCLDDYSTKVLESLINQKMIVQAATKKGVHPSQSEIDHFVKSKADKFGMSRERYLETILTKGAHDQAQLNQLFLLEFTLQLLLDKEYGSNEIQIGSRGAESLAAKLLADMQKQSEVQLVLNNPSLREQYPDVAALVNEDKITVQQLSDECFEKHGSRMLEKVISKTIIEQALVEQGITVTYDDIKAELLRVAKSIGGSADQLISESWTGFDSRPSSLIGGNSTMSSSIIDSHGQVERAWNNVAVRKLVADSVKISEAEMQRALESNYGPRAEVLAIVCKDQKQAQKVWSLAVANPTSELFGELANQYSVEPASRSGFGMVPPIQKHGGRPEMENAAFALKPNQISPIVQLGEYWVILFGKGQTSPVTDIDEAELRKEVLNKKIQQAMLHKERQLVDNATVLRVSVSNPIISALSNGAKAKTVEQKPAAKAIRFVTETYAVADLVVPSPFTPFRPSWNKEDRKKVDAQPLIDLVQEKVQPGSWNENGGMGTIQFFQSNLSLIVTHSSVAHDQIQDLLKKLRELNDVMIDLKGFLIAGPETTTKKLPMFTELTKRTNLHQREAEFLHGLSFVNDDVVSREFKPANSFNGQETKLELAEMEGTPFDEFSVTAVSSPDRKSVQVVVKFLNTDTKKLESVVVEKTENGQCLAVDVSRAFASGKKAFLVVRPYVLDLTEE